MCLFILIVLVNLGVNLQIIDRMMQILRNACVSLRNYDKVSPG